MALEFRADTDGGREIIHLIDRGLIWCHDLQSRYITEWRTAKGALIGFVGTCRGLADSKLALRRYDLDHRFLARHGYTNLFYLRHVEA